MITITRRMVLSAAVALGALSLMAVVQVASATHPRPKAASPLLVSLVPAYKQCASSNRTHGPPLAFPSCSPPVQTSNFLTVGTPDANSAPANSIGFVKFKVDPTSSDNLVITSRISDVRCKPGMPADVCNGANATDGPDYSGELEGNATVRVTDHFNAVAPGGGTDPATVIDLPSPFRLFCANTADTSTGGVCTVITGPCPPGGCSTIRNGDRTVIEVGQIQIVDGGADGRAGTAGNTLFEVQGIFIP